MAELPKLLFVTSGFSTAHCRLSAELSSQPHCALLCICCGCACSEVPSDLWSKGDPCLPCSLHFDWPNWSDLSRLGNQVVEEQFSLTSVFHLLGTGIHSVLVKRAALCGFEDGFCTCF